MFQNIRIYIISGIYKAYSKNLDSRYTRDIQGICQDISGIYNWHILGHTGDIYHVQDPSGTSGDWIGCIKVFRKYQLQSRIKTNSCTKISTTGERKTKRGFPDLVLKSVSVRSANGEKGEKEKKEKNSLAAQQKYYSASAEVIEEIETDSQDEVENLGPKGGVGGRGDILKPF